MAYGKQCDCCGKQGPVAWATYDTDGAKCYLCKQCEESQAAMIDRHLARLSPGHQAIAIMALDEAGAEPFMALAKYLPRQ